MISNMNGIEFFLPMRPPTVTAQERQVAVVNGKPRFYEPVKVREAREKLTAALSRAKASGADSFPESLPLEGPLELRVIWLFPRGKKHKNGEWRSTKPDTDNLQKMLKDCMTEEGFWQDDAQVCREVVEKRWSDEPTGIYVEVNSLE